MRGTKGPGLHSDEAIAKVCKLLIFVSPKSANNFKIADFGLAMKVDPTPVAELPKKYTSGTPGYHAPVSFQLSYKLHVITRHGDVAFA